jgi:hypothetical protein
MHSYRVTYHVVVEADDEEAARTKAAEAFEHAGHEGHADISVERMPDPTGPSSFVAEGVRRRRKPSPS